MFGLFDSTMTAFIAASLHYLSFELHLAAAEFSGSTPATSPYSLSGVVQEVFT